MEKLKLYVLNNKKMFIIVGIILLIVFGLIGYYFYYQHYQYEKIVVDLFEDNNEADIEQELFDETVDEKDIIESSGIDIKEEVQEEIIEYIYVDIKGYVNKPGVYKVEKNGNKRIYDLISLAGGLKKDADTSIINMSSKLRDEMVVIIYSKKELEDFVKTKETLTEKIEICVKEEVKNDACICEDDIVNKENNDSLTNNNVNDVTDNKEENDNSINNDNNSSKININTATKELLMTISGIGESKANAIISYRNEVGLFKKIEDIKNVSGIGDNVFEKIKDVITIE